MIDPQDFIKNDAIYARARWVRGSDVMVEVRGDLTRSDLWKVLLYLEHVEKDEATMQALREQQAFLNDVLTRPL